MDLTCFTWERNAVLRCVSGIGVDFCPIEKQMWTQRGALPLSPIT